MSGIVTSNILDSTGLIKTSSVAVGLTFISKQTASNATDISFTSGIDSTYKEYIFYFKDIHPATNGANFQFNANASGGSGYNETITSSFFYAYHEEGAGAQLLQYRTDYDLAQSTNFQSIAPEIGNENDECAAGYLHLFEPSSTTFVKHFISRFNLYQGSNYSIDCYACGYINSTSSIPEIKYQMSSGNLDGEICLYGLTK